MIARKALAAAIPAVLAGSALLPACGTAANCAGTAGNALNGKHSNPIHSKHGACLGPVGKPAPAPQPPAGGEWDCFKAIGGWNCKKPGVDPTLFPHNPNRHRRR